MDEKEYSYLDTHMFESDEQEYFDTSEKILRLSDELAEEIVLDNITEQLEDDLDTLNTRINYVTLFKEKYNSISQDDPFYDGEYIKLVLSKIATTIGNGLFRKYGVELGTDLDFETPLEYFTDMETLYEFLFIRHYENLVNYLSYMLTKNRSLYIDTYTPLMENEEHSKDLFVIQSKKKFKNKDDVLIMHFINEIIGNIKESCDSAYKLYETIVNLDLFEEYNNRMSELLINYGNKIVLNDDLNSAKQYMSPLDDSATYAEIRNQVLMKYLERCEIDD